MTGEARPAAATVSASYDGYERFISHDRSNEVALTHVYNGMDDRVATTDSSGVSSETRHFIYAPDGRVLGEYGADANDVRAEFIWMSPEVGDTGLFGAEQDMPLATSLRLAQQKLMDDPITSHPYYWAAFVVLGDGAKAFLTEE